MSQRWRDTTLAGAVERFPLRRDRFVRSGGETVDDLYGPDTPPDGVGVPGEYPFTRGIQPTMYRGRLWTMRQYAGFGTARQSNERYRYLLSQGQTGLSVAFDLPTQMGFDSDAALARGEVGRVGVAIDSIEDMDVLFDRIPLDEVSTSMTINSTASTLLALYVATAGARGIDPAQLRGTVQNDVLKEYIARGTYIYPPRASMRLITDLFAYCQSSCPRWNTISISGYHIREAGSTAAQELAFTVADGIAYVDAAVAAGLDVDSFAPRLSFFFNAHNNFFEEIGKFRAARRLWARTMKERFGAKDPRSWRMRFHTQTAGSTLTAQQVDNNVVRVTVQALAAVLGGTQSLHTNSRDEALALPTEVSARLALRTQQVLASETGVADAVDPLGGSWLVESLTDELEADACRYLDEIDGLGGMVAAIEEGYPQREIQDAAYRAQVELDRSDLEVVGVNIHTMDEPEASDLHRVDPRIEQEQVQRLQRLREQRDSRRVLDALDALQQGAVGSDNLLPLILSAVEVRATLGEISDALRTVFGEYSDPAIV